MPTSFAARCVLVAAAVLPAAAYNAPSDQAGPLTVRIDGPAELTKSAAPVAVAVTLDNSGSDTAAGRLRLAAIDGWTVAPAAVDFAVAGKASKRVEFTVTPAAGSYSAHYPLHASAEFRAGGQSYTAHPVLMVKTTFADAPHAQPPVPWQPFAVARNSRVALWRTPVRRAVLQVFGKPARMTAVAWQGTDPETRAVAQFGLTMTRGGVARECINLHEPYQGGAGTIVIEYPLALPAGETIRLRFANAVRDSAPGQTPGDGVTFRVRVLPLDAPEGRQGEIVFERHTDAKTWVAGEADLTRFAGRPVRLQLESHPGPRNNTSFDSSYWAEPELAAGQPPAPRPFPPPAGAASRTIGRIERSGVAYDIRIYPGERGLLDSAISFVAPGRALSFNGFHVTVLGDALEDARALSVLMAVRDESRGGRYRVRHAFRNWAGTFDLVGELWVERGALRAHLWLENVPARKPWLAVYLESAAAGAWSVTAPRVYAGVGNVLQDPQAFTLAFDGHRLATSFVGFDFAGGLSLVEAVDVPPLDLAVDPRARTYSLRAAHDPTLTFIPTADVWDGVKVWREINGLHAAGGVAKLAGRFAFDLWRGNYEASAAALARAFRYGLTDAVVVWHNWQRWGYDYRLPDIWPPNPQSGTEESFRALARTCTTAGVLFAPHDNYIDYYPDAEGFSYDRIAFRANGTPVAAWYNRGRAAQSYRWRPDRLFPSVERNVPHLRDAGATGYFIDVWSSAGPYDYWTRDGEFHDRLSTRKVWADTFTWIRNTLGGDAPQISESGHDQLIGALDGAQTNHLRVDRAPAGEYSWAVWNIAAADAERIPWIDAAHHDRFALHGAGYESRYASGLDTSAHGTYSDDYIATEVLDGHPAMVPAPFGRDVVRKYWLLHDLMRALALTRMEAHEFAGGDLHRQHVRWSNGGEVWVNRGASDWQVAGHTLPQYGFYARVPGGAAAVEAAIERRGGTIVEWSRSPAMEYSNARPYVSDRLPLAVKVAGIEYAGGRQFRLSLDWNVSGPLPDGCRIFVHFTDEAGNILFQGDHAGPGPSGEWRGAFRTQATVRVPDSVAAGRKVELRLGLYRPGGSERPRLPGWEDNIRRIRLGALTWSGDGVEWSAFAQPEDPLRARSNVTGRPVEFERLVTSGAVRVTHEGGATVLTPLPGGGPFEIRLRAPQGRTVEALDETRQVVSQSPARVENGVVILARDPAVFAYRLR